MFLFNLLISSILINYTAGVIKRGEIDKIVKMTELGSKIIKNEKSQDDNPDFVWILRDFELEVNDSNRYLEEQLNKNDQNILNYFKQRKCAFLPPWNIQDTRDQLIS